MTVHLIRLAHPKTKKPVDGLYYVECSTCGRLNHRGLTKVAAEARRRVHRCQPA